MKNETYTGVRVWAKQEKLETLIDPEDVSAGYQTRMRWRDESDWLRPSSRTHSSIISDELFIIARGRLSSGAPGAPRIKSSPHPYLLRGLLFCGHCGRRMQGAWRANRAADSPGRVLYRCNIRGQRSLAPELHNHPHSIYVREDQIVPALDSWIASVTSPEALAAGQHQPPARAATASLNQRIADLDRKITALITAIESGADFAALTDHLTRRVWERDGLRAQLTPHAGPRPLTTAEMEQALAELEGSLGCWLWRNLPRRLNSTAP